MLSTACANSVARSVPCCRCRHQPHGVHQTPQTTCATVVQGRYCTTPTGAAATDASTSGRANCPHTVKDYSKSSSGVDHCSSSPSPWYGLANTSLSGATSICGPGRRRHATMVLATGVLTPPDTSQLIAWVLRKCSQPYSNLNVQQPCMLLCSKQRCPHTLEVIQLHSRLNRPLIHA